MLFKKRKKTKDKDKLPLRKIVSYNLAALKILHRAGPGVILLNLADTLFYGLLNFITGTWLLRYILNEVQKGTADLRAIVRILLIVGVVQLVGHGISSWLWQWFRQRRNTQVRKAIHLQLFKQARRVELACYEDPAFYDKHVKAMDEAANRVWGVLGSVDEFFELLLQVLLSGGLLLTFDPFLVVFAIFPILFGLLRKKELEVYYKYVADLKPVDRRKKYIRRTFYQSDYAKEMRLTEMAPAQIEHFRSLYGKYKEVLQKHGWKRTILGFFGECSGDLISSVVSIIYAVYRTVVSGTMLVGDCAVTVNVISNLNYYLNQSVTRITQFSEHALYMRDMLEFLEYEPKIPENENGKIAEPGVIRFENVSFSYVGSDKKAVKNLSFEMRSGERLALVGMNGAGKSTIVKLLLRLYEPSDGRITLNGIDIKAYNLTSYRQLFSTMFQDYKAFSLTVAENVARRPLEEEDAKGILAALELAGVKERVDALPRGIDTMMTKEFDQDGAMLSGGENQKVQLAAVFFSGAPVAVLDEPSSALDPIAEYRVFEGMIAATEGKSVLFISHRLSSAVLADRILLLEDGSLSESGSHAELMQADGQYAAMFRRQAENYFARKESDDDGSCDSAEEE